ncbi:tocopherol cyclase family protein [Leptospira sp. 96542]|nr:tocopherol cyclase family protein [Leptospira sp. 96542]
MQKDDRNSYMLHGKKSKFGYDWWWHSFLAKDEETGELKPFFIEYYVINPALSPNKVILGQSKESKLNGSKPSYALLKAGTWGKDKAQLHSFFPSNQFKASEKKLEVTIGKAVLTETKLKGSISVSKEEAADTAHMCDAGNISWDLTAKKEISYSVGYGASPIFRKLGLFNMYWHVGGMFTRFEGSLEWNGKRYIVEPETSAGYQDKNWGVDYTSPWVWLNCNRFINKKDNKPLADTSLDVGGGRPIIAGIPIKQKLLIAFHHNDKFYEWNFSKFWTGTKQKFDCGEKQNPNDPSKTLVFWNIDAENRNHKIQIRFTCPQELMLKVNYENPKGEKRHNSLWNGGYASGEIILFEKSGSNWLEIGTFSGELGGCEYGVEDNPSS